MKRVILSAFTLFMGVSLFAQNSGYEKSIEINAGFPLDEYQKKTFGIGMVNGYRLNDNFSLGLGIGYEYIEGLYYHSYEYKGGIIGSKNYDSYDIRNNIQIYGRIKTNLTSTKVSPFLSCDFGYTIGLSDNDIKMANGLFFEPAFGMDFVLNDDQTIYFTVGYNGQNYDYEFFNLTLGSSGSEILNKRAGKLSVKFGFKF